MTERDGWFELSGDARLGRCATDGCGGQPTMRLEADGVGANYCSGCAESIRALSTTDTPEALESCPHCDDAGPVLTQAEGKHPAIGQWAVQCTNFWCRAAGGWFANEAEAIECWNRRTSTPPQPGVGDEVEVTGYGRDGRTGELRFVTIADDARKTSDNFVPASTLSAANADRDRLRERLSHLVSTSDLQAGPVWSSGPDLANEEIETWIDDLVALPSKNALRELLAYRQQANGVWEAAARVTTKQWGQAVNRAEAAEADRDRLARELEEARKALRNFGGSAVRDRIAARVGCNHDLLHDALQIEARAALASGDAP